MKQHSEAASEARGDSEAFTTYRDSVDDVADRYSNESRRSNVHVGKEGQLPDVAMRLPSGECAIGFSINVK